jgi:hypothetical protein
MLKFRAALCRFARRAVVWLRRRVDRCCLERPVVQHASQVSFHAGTIIFTAYRARNRSIKEMADRTASGDQGVLTTDAIVAIVLAAAAAEGFINELAENIGQYRQHASSWAPNAITPQMSAAADAIFDLEFQHGSVTDKYVQASAQLGHRFDKGGKAFQNFDSLIELRNAIMHIKPVRLSESHSGDAMTEALARQGHAIKRDQYSLPWFDRLQTPATARWACDVARATILAILDLIPQTPTDPLGLVQNLYRNSQHFNDESLL